ncbi:MAG: phosphoribosylglycinamide formyltransferase [Peptococcaceae bacterium]|nr:phosphoribosylglycinamide formyltransferase [Peptococcaceae bacterium]
MKKLRVGVLASGRGSNLQAIIDASEKGDIPAEVAVVVSDNARAMALDRAREHGIPAVHIHPPYYKSKEEYERRIVLELREYGVGLVCLAGYMRLVGKVLLEEFPNRIMNIHPALLPSFKGLHAQRQAVEYGVRFSGCTVHFVDEGMDSGPIILQAVVPVRQEDGEDDLSARILEQEHIIYPEAVRLFAEGRLRVEGRKVVILREEE